MAKEPRYQPERGNHQQELLPPGHRLYAVSAPSVAGISPAMSNGFRNWFFYRYGVAALLVARTSPLLLVFAIFKTKAARARRTSRRLGRSRGCCWGRWGRIRIHGSAGRCETWFRFTGPSRKHRD